MGLTLVEPLADEDVKVPGVIAMLVAPLVAQLSVLLEPDVILDGFALKEPMVGLPGVLTVTVSVDLVEPAVLVAVNVYVVVAAGFIVVEPVEEVDVNAPGVMAIVVAPVADQLSVLPDPALMLEGLAVNEAMVGMDPFPVGELEDDPPQPANPAATSKRMLARSFVPNEWSPWVGAGAQSGLVCIEVPEPQVYGSIRGG